jgi:hypothetical protein
VSGLPPDACVLRRFSLPPIDVRFWLEIRHLPQPDESALVTQFSETSKSWSSVQLDVSALAVNNSRVTNNNT